MHAIVRKPRPQPGRRAGVDVHVELAVPRERSSTETITHDGFVDIALLAIADFLLRHARTPSLRVTCSAACEDQRNGCATELQTHRPNETQDQRPRPRARVAAS